MMVLGAFGVIAAAFGGVAYWSVSRRFTPGDAGALNGIIPNPTAEHLIVQDVMVWDGVSHTATPRRSVIIRDGGARIASCQNSGTSQWARCFQRSRVPPTHFSCWRMNPSVFSFSACILTTKNP
jgi:hypothetical protein